MQNLFIAPERAVHLGRPVPTMSRRVAICRDVAAAMAFCHDRLSIVFGDINAKNELYRLDAVPMVLFIDCDSVRVKGDLGGARQLNAPDWAPPDPGPLTMATDLYKLGLFVLRCLTSGGGHSIRTDPAGARTCLDGRAHDLPVRALGSVPAARHALPDGSRLPADQRTRTRSRPAPRPREETMRFRTGLARLAGSRQEIPDEAPGELTKHAAMGGILLSTAALAGVSAFFALTSTLDLSWPVSAVAALGWAAIVLNLDRMLVISMNDLGTVRMKVLAGLPRVLLALVIGSVISTPLLAPGELTPRAGCPSVPPGQPCTR
ncbi:DUF4407 domain-containing protein [Amycolatopsis cihanbeyliensis]|uniref:Uncharacterized protein DUF4407 n=1 Tax=Amycolatopsis cihanbeyliensis TaxID=1128664 RepID=A0A542DI86_AMYCI|nr:DUF4407 domain-containing protein [Amycolatopsis cihanbeyliensis]TQJ02793.1 uncharacterized protein DUF4407 [Amycolatopsis cihanbeyliensis]